MLKKTIQSLSLILLSAALCSFSFGGGNSKVAVVDLQACNEESALAKAESKKLEELKNKLRTDLESKETALKSMKDKYDDPDFRDSLSDQAKKDYEQQMGQTYRELEQYHNQFIRNLQQSGYELAMSILASIETATVKIAKEKGLEMVIRKEGTLFYDPSLDITKEVIAEMDNSFKSVSSVEENTTTEKTS